MNALNSHDTELHCKWFQDWLLTKGLISTNVNVSDAIAIGNKLSANKFSNNKFSNNKLSHNKLSHDKLSEYKLSRKNLSNDKLYGNNLT